MADEIPVIPKAGTFLVHTGNIVNWNRLKRKLTQSPTEELTECIGSTINNWAKNADKNELQYATDIECLNDKFLEKLPEDERSELKLTVKIFLSNPEKATLKTAIDKALCELGTSYIETVILAVPDNKHNLDDIKSVWETLEDWVSKEKVFSLGVADLNKDQLEELHNWAKAGLFNLPPSPNVRPVLQVKPRVFSLGMADLNKEQLEELHNWAKVKPSVAQVNLDVCCVVPPEMQEFTKENDIQLLTHNDPADILPVKSFQDVLIKSFSSRDIENWEPSWVVRYSVLVKCRGVIKTKGYIMKAERNTLKKRK